MREERKRSPSREERRESPRRGERDERKRSPSRESKRARGAGDETNLRSPVGKRRSRTPERSTRPRSPAAESDVRRKRSRTPERRTRPRSPSAEADERRKNGVAETRVFEREGKREDRLEAGDPERDAGGEKRRTESDDRDETKGRVEADLKLKRIEEGKQGERTVEDLGIISPQAKSEGKGLEGKRGGGEFAEPAVKAPKESGARTPKAKKSVGKVSKEAPKREESPGAIERALRAAVERSMRERRAESAKREAGLASPPAQAGFGKQDREGGLEGQGKEGGFKEKEKEVGFEEKEREVGFGKQEGGFGKQAREGGVGEQEREGGRSNSQGEGVKFEVSGQKRKENVESSGFRKGGSETESSEKKLPRQGETEQPIPAEEERREKETAGVEGHVAGGTEETRSGPKQEKKDAAELLEAKGGREAGGLLVVHKQTGEETEVPQVGRSALPTSEALEQPAQPGFEVAEQRPLEVPERPVKEVGVPNGKESPFETSRFGGANGTAKAAEKGVEEAQKVVSSGKRHVVVLPVSVSAARTEDAELEAEKLGFGRTLAGNGRDVLGEGLRHENGTNAVAAAEGNNAAAQEAEKPAFPAEAKSVESPRLYVAEKAPAPEQVLELPQSGPAVSRTVGKAHSSADVSAKGPALPVASAEVSVKATTVPAGKALPKLGGLSDDDDMPPLPSVRRKEEDEEELGFGVLGGKRPLVAPKVGVKPVARKGVKVSGGISFKLGGVNKSAENSPKPAEGVNKLPVDAPEAVGSVPGSVTAGSGPVEGVVQQSDVENGGGLSAADVQQGLVKAKEAPPVSAEVSKELADLKRALIDEDDDGAPVPDGKRGKERHAKRRRQRSESSERERTPDETSDGEKKSVEKTHSRRESEDAAYGERRRHRSRSDSRRRYEDRYREERFYEEGRYGRDDRYRRERYEVDDGGRYQAPDSEEERREKARREGRLEDREEGEDRRAYLRDSDDSREEGEAFDSEREKEEKRKRQKERRKRHKRSKSKADGSDEDGEKDGGDQEGLVPYSEDEGDESRKERRRKRKKERKGDGDSSSGEEGRSRKKLRKRHGAGGDVDNGSGEEPLVGGEVGGVSDEDEDTRRKRRKERKKRKHRRHHRKDERSDGSENED